jgi:hypothetical protein
MLTCSYREELDEIIDYGEQTTSADNTEAEASDGPYKPEKKVKSKKKRMSRLPWSKDSEASGSESKLSLSLPQQSNESQKLQKKLQKKKRVKDSSSQSATSPVATPASEMSPSERGLGTLSPPPWTQHTNLSQQSLNASIPSRRSHISSARSSIEAPRTITTVDRRPGSGAAGNFDDIRRLNATMDDDDLPRRVIIPAAREERARAGSQSSNHSAGSTGKGGKIGAWLRKKRGFSVSSSTSVGGGSGAVSD